MCNDIVRKQHQQRRGIEIDSEELEEVSEYKYLGRMITTGNDMSKEIDQIITSGWRWFGEYSDFLKEKKMPICLKRKIMNTVVLPAMTYGAETWTLTKQQERKLAVAQRRMERAILNVTWREKIMNEAIRAKTKVKDITDKVRELRGQWAGHLARMNYNRSDELHF